MYDGTIHSVSKAFSQAVDEAEPPNMAPVAKLREQLLVLPMPTIGHSLGRDMMLNLTQKAIEDLTRSVPWNLALDTLRAKVKLLLRQVLNIFSELDDETKEGGEILNILKRMEQEAQDYENQVELFNDQDRHMLWKQSLKEAS